MQETIFDHKKPDDFGGLLRLGTSGWSYKDWVGNFYPPKTPSTKWLQHYVTRFNFVEVDSTFYAIPPRERLVKWKETAPEGFEFALKIPQIITHEKSLLDCGREMNEFLHVAEALEEKLGPILFQFPRTFRPERMRDLLNVLDSLPHARFKFAVEVRHEAWLTSGLVAALTTREIPLVSVDRPRMKGELWTTGNFAYVRWQGERKGIDRFDRVQRDRREDLNFWAAKIAELLQRKIPVYGFFGKYFSGHPPSDVLAFANLLKLRRGTA